MKKFFKEFGDFISKGNAFDLAVGIIIGGAFNKIIQSLVKDIIMPLISLIGGKDFTLWYIVLKGNPTYDPLTGALLNASEVVLLTYGNFIQAIIDFLIIAFAIFLAIKVMTKVKAKAEIAKAKLIKKETEKAE
ncbi:MAG: large conductance mechanosensitive channel protein MscL [Tenericutes bacterium HGW-Tenericutes-1]|jgi:large conductance mechanosensitive channel|nr:MAG: large conductance mechanosensitive channel protein MscL [Tenericutes bacterium HGW-Tenericutes-1]